jgi:(2R)-sulfolactate sulfo-lyase subunit alpha
MIHFVVPRRARLRGRGGRGGREGRQKLNGWIMDQDKDIQVEAKSDIPIGHKLAIKPLKSGDTVIKYGVDIGKTVANISVGEHTHVQNLRTKRW